MTIIQQIKNHRSIRQYKSTSIPDNVLQQVIETAYRASSSGNMQLTSIIVTKEEEKKKKLWEIHSKQSMILQAPILLTFCADWNRMNKWCTLRNAKPSYDNLLSFLVAMGDTFVLAQNAAIAAESIGLGICFMGTTLYNFKALTKFFQCPVGVAPVTTLVIGYPNEEPPLRDRLPLENIIHQEKYKDYTNEQIEQCYHQRETEGWKRYEENLELKKKMKSYGVENLAQIYTQLKYTEKFNVSCSEEVMETLKNQGFMK